MSDSLKSLWGDFKSRVLYIKKKRWRPDLKDTVRGGSLSAKGSKAELCGRWEGEAGLCCAFSSMFSEEEKGGAG